MRTVIWGCGNIGRMVYKPLIDYHNMQIVVYTDSFEKFKGIYIM